MVAGEADLHGMGGQSAEVNINAAGARGVVRYTDLVYFVLGVILRSSVLFVAFLATVLLRVDGSRGTLAAQDRPATHDLAGSRGPFGSRACGIGRWQL